MKNNDLLKTTDNSRIYKFAQRRTNGCSFCRRNRRCNATKRNRKPYRNWKNYRKYQYKDVNNCAYIQM